MSNNYYYSRNFFAATLQNGGSYAINVDGSVTPVEFAYTPAANTVVEISTLTLSLWTSGKLVQLGRFMDFLAALTNGIDLGYTNNSVETILYNLKSNADLSIKTGSFIRQDTLDKNTRTYVDINFPDKVVLDSQYSDKFWLRVNDDLTSLLSSGVLIEGGKFNV